MLPPTAWRDPNLRAVEALNSPEGLRGIRNLIILAKTVGSIDPALLQLFAGAVARARAQTKSESSRPPGMWALFQRFRRKDRKRGLSLVNSLLETWGRNLAAEQVHNRE